MMLNGMVNNTLGVARDMDRLFDSMMTGRPAPGYRYARPLAIMPAMTLWHDQDNLYLEVDVPGIRMEDIDLRVTAEDITLRAARHAKTTDDAELLRQERAFGAMERCIPLPTAIDSDNIDATLHDGVLSVTLPKAPENRPRTIEIKALPNAS